MNSATRVRVTGLFIYPLKSSRGIQVERAEVDALGFRHDRRWMAVDADRRFLSQREHPRLALIVPRLEDGRMVLSAPDLPELDLPLSPGSGFGRRVRVRIWDDDVEAVETRGDASAWITEFLGTPARLAYMPDGSFRPVSPPHVVGRDRRTAFTDGYPFLLVSEDSLSDLNRRLKVPLPLDRFRPNIVVRGAGPYEEDGWSRFSIDGVPFHVVKRCGRCIVTTIDQGTARKGEEPLRILATYRTIDGKICFGVNLVHTGRGRIGAGSLVCP